MNSPCYRCVCLAICKFKPIYYLYKECKLLSDYCRPFGSDRVDLTALSNTNQNLGRNFQAIKHDDSDYWPNIIRDVDKLEEFRKVAEVKGIEVKDWYLAGTDTIRE